MKISNSSSSLKTIIGFGFVSAFLFLIYFLAFYKQEASSAINSEPEPKQPISYTDSLLPSGITEFGLENQELIVPSGIKLKSTQSLVNNGNAKVEGILEGDLTNNGTLILSGKVHGKLINKGTIRLTNQK
jgi:hypothetical protein